MVLLKFLQSIRIYSESGKVEVEIANRDGIILGKSVWFDIGRAFPDDFCMFEISGKIKLIEETQSFNSGFTKREFVVTTGDSKWPQDIKFEIVKDKCSLLDSFSVGQEVNVNFDIRGNEYNGRYYVNLNCWKIQAAGGQAAQQGAPANEPNFDNPFGNEPEPSASDLGFHGGDDIPF